MREGSLPLVSVIVPVYNDTDRLKKCLEQLESQPYPTQSYEVIVVDNASDESPATAAEPYAHARLIGETKPGSYAARNAALDQAKGDFLAFTDSDCLPYPDWLAQGVKALMRMEGYGVVAGHVEINFRRLGKPNWVELYDSVTSLNQKRWAQHRHFAATANAFTHKSVFDRIGLFNEALKSGGDNEWGNRAAAAGYQIVYCPEAVVTHPARSRFGQVLVKRRRLVGGELEKRLDGISRQDDAGRFFRLGHLVKVVWRSLLPHRDEMGIICRDRKLTGRWQRVKVATVFVVLHYMTVLERICLRLGRDTERR